MKLQTYSHHYLLLNIWENLDDILPLGKLFYEPDKYPMNSFLIQQAPKVHSPRSQKEAAFELIRFLMAVGIIYNDAKQSNKIRILALRTPLRQ